MGEAVSGSCRPGWVYYAVNQRLSEVREPVVTSRRDRISEYFRRQYETREGTNEENVRALFDEDLVFHLTGDKSIGLEDFITLCDLMRRTRHGQKALVTEFEEEGDVVSFVLYLVGTDPVTGHEASVSTRTNYRFSGDKVVEVWQEDPAGVENAVRAAGVRPS